MSLSELSPGTSTAIQKDEGSRPVTSSSSFRQLVFREIALKEVKQTLTTPFAVGDIEIQSGEVSYLECQ